jgi:hypothetical protein
VAISKKNKKSSLKSGKFGTIFFTKILLLWVALDIFSAWQVAKN